jgi:hypothetical protein
MWEFNKKTYISQQLFAGAKDKKAAPEIPGRPLSNIPLSPCTRAGNIPILLT